MSEGLDLIAEHDDAMYSNDEELFDVVRRGFNRDQVLHHLATLHERIAALEAEGDALRSGRPPWDELGDRIGQILRLAQEQAEEMVSTAQRETAERLAAARAQAAGIEAIVRDRRTAAEAEADRLIELAQEESDRQIAQTRGEVEQALHDAREQVETLTSQARTDAEQRIGAARAESEQMLSEAREVAERTLTQGRERAATEEREARALLADLERRREDAAREVATTLERLGAVFGPLAAEPVAAAEPGESQWSPDVADDTSHQPPAEPTVELPAVGGGFDRDEPAPSYDRP